MIRKIMNVVLLLFAFSCTNKEKNNNTHNRSSYKHENSTDDEYDLMNIDKKFSHLSKEKGMKHAFMEYIDSNGILLRPNEPLLVGADAIDYLLQTNDTSYTLEWEPKDAMIAQSGDLGFTYGYYMLTPNNTDTILKGTYVSIWRKQKNGNWKFLLDTGNEGVGEK